MFVFCFTLCRNEFIYAQTFLSTTSQKTVPVAIVNEFVDGDIYRWGSLMAGALAGSLPLVILYAFFIEHYYLSNDRRGEGIGSVKSARWSWSITRQPAHSIKIAREVRTAPTAY